MGAISVVAILVLVCCAFVTSLSPPAPVAPRLKSSFVPLQKRTPALPKASVTSRKCSVVRRQTYFRRVTMPFLCHAGLKRVIPWPSEGPMTSVQAMVTMNAKGWVPCPRVMPVPFYKFQRTPVCCPGTIPTPFGTCLVKTTVVKKQTKTPAVSMAPLAQLMRYKQQQRQLQSGTRMQVKKPLQNLRPRTPPASSPAARAVPIFPMLWKMPRPYRGFVNSGPRKALGTGRSPPTELLRKMAAKALRTRGQKAAPVVVKPRPSLPVPVPVSKPLAPPKAFLLALLSSLMQQSQKPSFKQQLAQKLTKPGTSSSSPRPVAVAKAKALLAASALKPLKTKTLLKSKAAALSKVGPPLGPLFGPSPLGPLFGRMSPKVAGVQGLPPRPMVGPFPRALLDDLLFYPGPLSLVSKGKPLLLPDLMDELLFGSAFKKAPVPQKGTVPNFRFPWAGAGSPGIQTQSPPLMGAGPLQALCLLFKAMAMQQQRNVELPLNPAAFLFNAIQKQSRLGPPLSPAALLSSLRPPTLQDLLRNPMFPGKLLSNIRPPMSATSALTSKPAPIADLLAKALSISIAAELLSQSSKKNSPPQQQQTSKGPAFSASSVGPLSNIGAPNQANPGSPASTSSQDAAELEAEKKKSGAGLSAWEKDVARYLATMMYAKLQVEHQHKTLVGEITRQNSLNRQMELLLAQQFLQSQHRLQMQQQQHRHQQLQRQQQQKLEEKLQQAEEEPDVTFLGPPVLDSRPMPIPVLKGLEEDLDTITSEISSSPVLLGNSLPSMGELPAQEKQAEETASSSSPASSDVSLDASVLDDMQSLPFGPGILDELPAPRAPIFTSSTSGDSQGADPEMTTGQAQDVREQVKAIVNDCLRQADIPHSMEHILQTGQPENLRPVCSKSETVGPCVLAQTQEMMGQDAAGAAGRQLVGAVLMALGETCAKLEAAEVPSDPSITESPQLAQEDVSAAEGLSDPSITEATSTPVFPNPPPELVQEVVTELPMIETVTSKFEHSTNSVEVVAPDMPEVVSPEVLMDSAVTPLAAKKPEVNQQNAQAQEAEPEVTENTEDPQLALPMWMILVIIGTCAALLLLTCACVCLVFRCRSRKMSSTINREPDQFPVPTEVKTTLPAPPMYQKSDVDVTGDNFRIPEDVEKKEGVTTH